MECFYHEGRPAVGSCRSCLKGICRACLVDLERGLACVNRCEQAVRDLIATIDQSVRYRSVSGGLLTASRSIWSGLAVVALLVGTFVIVWGLTLPMFREVAWLGLPFLALGAIALGVARKVRSAPLADDPKPASPA